MTSSARFAWLKWFPRDFQSATRGWPLVARGAYRELLDVAWDMGSLPADPRELRALISATAREWRAAWPFLESKFQIGSDGRRRNARLEEHRHAALEEHDKRARGAAMTNAKLGRRSASRAATQ
jgi:uncharacterized protein YdaU (DUF1376 family)